MILRSIRRNRRQGRAFTAFCAAALQCCVMANSVLPAAEQNPNDAATTRSPGPNRVPSHIAAAVAQTVATMKAPIDSAIRRPWLGARVVAVNAAAPTSEAAATQR